jgi:hypothetical protein
MKFCREVNWSKIWNPSSIFIHATVPCIYDLQLESKFSFFNDIVEDAVDLLSIVLTGELVWTQLNRSAVPCDTSTRHRLIRGIASVRFIKSQPLASYMHLQEVYGCERLLYCLHIPQPTCNNSEFERPVGIWKSELQLNWKASKFTNYFFAFQVSALGNSVRSIFTVSMGPTEVPG